MPDCRAPNAPALAPPTRRDLRSADARDGRRVVTVVAPSRPAAEPGSDFGDTAIGADALAGIGRRRGRDRPHDPPPHRPRSLSPVPTVRPGECGADRQRAAPIAAKRAAASARSWSLPRTAASARSANGST
jgi:hypothetical protein